MTVMDGGLAAIARAACYDVFMLPASVSFVGGRDHRGILLFVKHCWPVTALCKVRNDVGEYIDLVLDRQVCLFVCYRDGAR